MVLEPPGDRSEVFNFPRSADHDPPLFNTAANRTMSQLSSQHPSPSMQAVTSSLDPPAVPSQASSTHSWETQPLVPLELSLTVPC